MKKIFVYLTAALAAIGCNESSLSEIAPSEDGQTKIVVSLSTPSATTSRVDVVDNGEGGYAVTWSQGDVIGGWCDGVYNNSTFNEFTMVSGSYSAEKASFEGSISYVDALDNVRFVYPYSSSLALYNKDNTVDSYTTYMNAFDISLAMQSAKADLSHLDAATYMVSDALVLSSDDDDFESTELNMRHIGAAMDLRLKLNNAVGYSLTKVVLSGIPSVASINLLKDIDDEDFMELNAQSSDITIEVDSFEATGDIYSAVFNILPFTLEKGDAISVVATFVDAADVEYTAEGSVEAQSSVEFARATRNYFGVTLGELSEATVVDPVETNEYIFEYSDLSTSWTNDTEMTIGDMDWYIDGMRTSTSYGNIGFSYYNSVGGSCYNQTAFGEGVTEVVVSIKDGSGLKLYAGASENPTTNEITPTISGSTYTYTLSGTMPYLLFKNSSTTYLNINSIVVKYLGDSQGGDQGGDQSGDQSGSESVISLDKDVLGLGAYATATKSVDGCDFAYYLGCFDSKTMQFKSGSSYIYNTTALSSLSKIVVTKSGNNNIILYVGTSSNPSSTAVTASVSGDVSTYEIPDGYTHFNLKNGSGASYILTIDVYYWASGGSTGSDGSDGSTEGGTEGGSTEGGSTEGDGTTTTPSTGAAYGGWAELPAEISDQGNYYYAYHTVSNGSATVRNFGACYSSDYTCPVWVAGPMHSSYTGSTSRTDAYADDPQIDCYQVETLGSPYNRGHMIASSDRTASTAMNKQAFYLSNIAPQLISYFNSGGGIWNNYEDYIQDQYQSRSDTLYIVNGCHWENTNTVVSGTTVPTHYYKAVLRTKTAGSTKWVGDCSADELECVAFYFEHKSSQDDPKSSHMISIAELEEKTGWSYFPNVPNAPKESFSASDWDL